jgi:hypothetical protein
MYAGEAKEVTHGPAEIMGQVGEANGESQSKRILLDWGKGGLHINGVTTFPRHAV